MENSKKVFIFAAAIAMGFALTSCDKNDVLNTDNATAPSRAGTPVLTVDLDNIQINDGMLFFESYEEFESAMQQANELTDDKRLDWEKSIGFESWERKTSEFYSSIDFDEFSGDAEVLEFINKYSDILSLELKETQEGTEAMVSVHYLKLPERCIMNADRMYVIGKTVYKHFPNDVEAAAEATPRNINILRQVQDIEVEMLSSNPEFEVYVATVPPAQAPYLGGQPQPPAGAIYDKWLPEVKSNDGKYRNRLNIFSEVKRKWTLFGGYKYYYARTGYTMINEHHKRWLGFLWWYWDNEKQQTDGSIKLKNTVCGFGVNSQYFVSTVDIVFDIHRKIKKETKYQDHSIQAYYPNNFGGAPWSCISGGSSIYYTVDKTGTRNWYY
jgi:hypothetical protein